MCVCVCVERIIKLLINVKAKNQTDWQTTRQAEPSFIDILVLKFHIAPKFAPLDTTQETQVV